MVILSLTFVCDRFHQSYAYDYEANGELRPEPPAKKKSVALQVSCGACMGVVAGVLMCAGDCA